MKATIEHKGRTFRIDLEKPLHISFPITADDKQLRAWWVDPVRMEPVVADGHVYSVAEGSAVNFRNIHFNPHGHGTHTECVGHITEEIHSIDSVLRCSFFVSRLVSIQPIAIENIDGAMDRMVTQAALHALLDETGPEALIIRTLPNDDSKCTADYSGTNPPYLETEALAYLREIGVKHLLLDLPSVDRESDGGALAGHKAFWSQPGEPDFERTITELIYVPKEIKDGEYLLEIQIAPFANDASPSRPILYTLL